MIATAPRYLLQGVAFGGMLLIILGMLILQSASLGTILPLLAVYAFAGLRLLAGDAAWSTRKSPRMRFNQPAARSPLHTDITEIRARARRRRSRPTRRRCRCASGSS